MLQSIMYVYIYIYNYIIIYIYCPRNSDFTLFDHKYVGFPRIFYHFPRIFRCAISILSHGMAPTAQSGLSRRSAGPPGAGGSVSARSPAAAGSWPRVKRRHRQAPWKGRELHGEPMDETSGGVNQQKYREMSLDITINM